jgi:DNA transformation protein
MAKKARPAKASATTRKSARGTLQSMRVTDGFRAFVLEQLEGIPSLRARAMFGGVGLYAGDVFFGIVARDTLYLKVDDSNRRQYEDAGMPAFTPYADKPMTMTYYQVPAATLENADELTTWARSSVRVATGIATRTPRR